MAAGASQDIAGFNANTAIFFASQRDEGEKLHGATGVIFVPNACDIGPQLPCTSSQVGVIVGSRICDSGEQDL
jgi:hypothetical protein